MNNLSMHYAYESKEACEILLHNVVRAVRRCGKVKLQVLLSPNLHHCGEAQASFVGRAFGPRRRQ